MVTPVSLDHTRYLGSTVEEIAADKAGIIKPGAVAVLAQQPVAAAEALLRRTAEVGATVAREGLEFGVLDRDLAVGGQRLELRGLRGDYHEIFLPLFGAHQAGNAACALAAVEAFAGAGDDDPADGGAAPFDETWVREAFASVSSPGRLEVVRRSPVIIVDAAHNPAGMAAAAEAVTEAFTFDRLIGVLAVSADKDVSAMLDQLEPVVSDLVVTRNSSPRSMEVSQARRPGRGGLRAGPRAPGRAPGRGDRGGGDARRRGQRRGWQPGQPRAGSSRGAHRRVGDHGRRRAGTARPRRAPSDLGQPAGRPPEQEDREPGDQEPGDQEPGDRPGEPEPGSREPGEPDSP